MGSFNRGQAQSQAQAQASMNQYLALAPRYQVVTFWCHTWGIRVRNIRMVSSMRDIRGRDGYTLLYFPEWYGTLNPLYLSSTDEISQVARQAMQRAARTIYIESAEPIVQDGIVLDWRKKEL